MIEVGTVQLIVNMAESQNINAENLAADVLLRLAYHGVISDNCIIVELTDCI
jgi:hypothetical protein